jgi:hypothetical protein
MRLQENFNEFQVAIIDQTLTKMTNTDSKGICFFYFILLILWLQWDSIENEQTRRKQNKRFDKNKRHNWQI